MPITSIHWWGSYQGWQGSTLPAIQPDSWRITFSANLPPDTYTAWSRPGTQLKQFEVEPNRVSLTWVGVDHFPDKPSDSCFEYSLTLNPTEYFWSGVYDGNDVFWIGITALYKTQRSNYVWGWKTRPAQWGAGAVKYVSSLTTTPSGQQISSIAMFPLTATSPCGQNATYDMTFAFDTDPSWIQVEQPFTGLRDWAHYADETSKATGTAASSIAIKWQQLPDLSSSGQDVDATIDSPKTWNAEILADDFQCTIPGPITLIDIWGSWYFDALPGGDAGNADFTLSIREDLPPSGSRTYSMPGKVLWTKTFKKGQFTVQASTSADQGFSSSAASQYIQNNHYHAYKYTFAIDSAEAFAQTGTADKPVVYWLSVQAQVTHVTGMMYRFGWKTSTSTWNDDAVWAQAQEPYSGTWQKWSYPALHPRSGQKTAMAFTITTSSYTTFQSVERQVADDWKSDRNLPVIAASWSGSYLGYTYQPCACNDKPVPTKPDYFLLSIWSNVPDPDVNNPQDFSQPGQKLWEYEASDYDEVLVGFDKDPPDANTTKGREPVYRYTVNLPISKWFTPAKANDTYWFSVMAVYAYPKVANYPWGWTNHSYVFGGAAVAGTDRTDSTGKKVRTWQPLKDETGASADMSFTLFQQVVLVR
jgi:hypothetical protein